MALAVLGFVKRKFTGVSKVKSALETLMVGGCAAGVSYALAKLISQAWVIRQRGLTGGAR